MATGTSSDRIEKEIVLRAPRARVWQALTDSQEFGTWFGAKIGGAFAVGSKVKGQITVKGYEHLTMELDIVSLEPQTYFAYRWHPYAVDPKTDYSGETPTLVAFRLSDAAGGTRLTVVESGFDKLPAARRSEAFRMNDNGWTGQMRNIERHVTTS